jgi:Short C-terminal domain
MKNHDAPRSKRPDLLERPPATARDLGPGWALLVIDPVRQLRELADLHRRGLVSGEEYQQQKCKILDL